MMQNSFGKRFQVYAYTCTSLVLVGLLLGVGYLYKSNQVAASDSVLMFILAQVLGSWAALTSKIFRIPAAGSNNSDNA